MFYICSAAMLVMFLLYVGYVNDIGDDAASTAIYYSLWLIAAYYGTYGIVNILFK